MLFRREGGNSLISACTEISPPQKSLKVAEKQGFGT